MSFVNKKTLTICNVQRSKEKKLKIFSLPWPENYLKLKDLKLYNPHRLKKEINLKAIRDKSKRKAVVESRKRKIVIFVFIY